MSKRVLFNDKWFFTKQKIGTEFSVLQDSSIQWNAIDIPHDFAIYQTSDFYEDCQGWYKKKFPIQNTKQENQRYLLRFEGIYMDSTIFVNGITVGEWKYGYTTFEVDITDALRDGINEVMVQVVIQVPNSRWYAGAGIYRNVWLKTVPESHFVSDGIYISTEQKGENWDVIVNCETECAGGMDSYRIRHTVIDKDGNEIVSTESTDKTVRLQVSNPYVWDIQSPDLYTLKSELLRKDKLVDTEVNRFGFRTIQFDASSGFYLNHRHVKLHGVCQHHDLGALGAAVNKAAIRRQLKILRKMGVNSIRTSHNMPAVEFMELADEMGFLINSEAFDIWEKSKTPYDYARFFKDWSERDVAAWIRRDRNHPSIIMWSIGNEIYDTHAGVRGQELTRYLMEQVDKHDPNKNGFVTFGSNYMPWENTQKCADILKLAGYNYGELYYERHHETYPDWRIYGSETGSVVQSRGIYHFPLSQNLLSDDDEQCSSLGNSSTSWGAKSTEQCIINDRDAEFSAGMYIWSGFDYIGEPTPYHTKNSYFGQIDTAGFPKDSYYIYQAEWTDYKKAPMVHLFPYWDFNEGQTIDVRVCSNAPKVALFYNEVLMGTYAIDHKHGTKLVADWQIEYHKGVLRAAAYDEKDTIIAEDRMCSFEDSQKISLEADKMQMLADGQDLVFVTISTEDRNGNPVYNATNRVNVKVSGAGRFVGMDNGDSSDYESYKGTSRKLFSGKVLAIIAAKTEPGKINVEVTSEGLEPAVLELTAVKAKVQEGVSATEENVSCLASNDTEVPIRKLEIVHWGSNKLNQEHPKLDLQVKIYPENATYDDIQWNVVSSTGAASNIAKITAKGKEAQVEALGDGIFYVRAMSKNGSNNIRLISSLDFSVTGLGEAYFNPYEFISGSLYTRGYGELGQGNERGVSSGREGTSIITFDKLNFGTYGSDEITIPIFELGGDAVSLQIYEGVPGEEKAELLADVIYQKPVIWNVYQPETYHLSKKLKGVTTISFVLQTKIHLKGFSFTKGNKAYETRSVLECNRLYGDTFTKHPESITGIGNNVVITFDEMDFGEKGFRRLMLCGRSPIEKNTIHVRFSSDAGEVKQIAEFVYSEDYVEREFPLESVTGMQTVSFLFLPGCNFDFKWFRFE